MNKHLYIGSISILKLFALLYPICPGYFYVGGIAVREMILLFTAIMLVILTKGFVVTKRDRAYPLFIEIFIWSSVMLLLQMYHSEWIIVYTQVSLWLVVVYVGSEVINTKERFFSIIDCVIVGSIIVGVFGLVEEFTHFNFFSLVNTIGSKLNYNPTRLGILRIISFTSHAISYGCYCLIMLALIIYRLTVEKKRFLYFAGALMLLNEGFAMSRGPMIGLAIMFVLILWFSGHQLFIRKVFRWFFVLVIIVLISSIFVERARNLVKLSGYVVLAMIDEDYASALAEYGFMDNASGIGNRIDLYKWVYDESAGHRWVGRGAYKTFEHKFINSGGYVQTKSSIEVEWLRTFYRYGAIGLLAEIYFFLMLIIHAMNKRMKAPDEWEGHLSFARVVTALLMAYTLVLFSVMQNQEVQVFAVVIMLLVAYSRIRARSKAKNEYEAIGSN